MEIAAGGSRYTVASGRGTAATAKVTQQKTAFEFGSGMVNTFDQVGNSITQAFVSGGAASVKFGGAINAVSGQVGQHNDIRRPLPLNRYAGGGIARSAQISIFGEGDLPISGFADIERLTLNSPRLTKPFVKLDLPPSLSRKGATQVLAF